MNQEMIAKAEGFLKDAFAASPGLQSRPAEQNYRLEHSYRVANIAKQIAQAEGFDVTCSALAGLLHDIAYCEEMTSREDWLNHGRRSATIARPFLESLGLPENAVGDICYSIAIHVDHQADFAWPRTLFSETVGDADNLDRFDAYRIYATLESERFHELPLEKKRETVCASLERLDRLRESKLATPSANTLWLQRIDYSIGFYEKLRAQLDSSSTIR